MNTLRNIQSIRIIFSIILGLLSACANQSYAQGFLPKYDNKNQSKTILKSQVVRRGDNNLVGYRIENGDTVYIDHLKEITVYYRPDNWKKSKAWRDYYKMVWNFKKVYPYALKAKEITVETDNIIRNSNFTKKERDKYISAYEKRLFKEFEKPLKNLSISQGKLLLKLLDRELGQTSFYVIKSYKGGISAGFWQGIAKLFGSDLKKPYDKYGEDKQVEELVRMYWNGTFDNLYYSMFVK